MAMIFKCDRCGGVDTGRRASEAMTGTLSYEPKIAHDTPTNMQLCSTCVHSLLDWKRPPPREAREP